eukprot:CAMPEP_0185857268 /NCGR_PEP_ID=MMETSP1354-20130828/29421_1 /TAXON_ID=708628 /ORGANISM="Erythrolobus madagascarensis, Strain CCMP3276" /LENGTH=437 /DNA_ID=CAMNT_0028559535 /DNA_START=112 /DNA_END=1425 /DNA_ORIENTATION=-
MSSAPLHVAADPHSALLLEVRVDSNASNTRDTHAALQLISSWYEFEELEDESNLMDSNDADAQAEHSNRQQLLITRVATLQFDLVHRSEDFAASLCAPDLVALEIAKRLIAAHFLQTRVYLDEERLGASGHLIESSLVDDEQEQQQEEEEYGAERESCGLVEKLVNRLVLDTQKSAGGNYARVQEMLRILEAFVASVLVQRKMHVDDAYTLRRLFCSCIEPSLSFAIMVPAMFAVVSHGVDKEDVQEWPLCMSSALERGKNEGNDSSLRVFRVHADASRLTSDQVLLLDAGADVFIWRGRHGDVQSAEFAARVARTEAQERRWPRAQVHETLESGPFERAMLCRLLNHDRSSTTASKTRASEVDSAPSDFSSAPASRYAKVLAYVRAKLQISAGGGGAPGQEEQGSEKSGSFSNKSGSLLRHRSTEHPEEDEFDGTV